MLHNISIFAAVGRNAKTRAFAENREDDVYVVKALLNTFARNAGRTEIPSGRNSGLRCFDSTVDDVTLGLICDAQRTLAGMQFPDGVISPAGHTFRKLVQKYRDVINTTTSAISLPSVGAFSFLVEGQEGGPYDTRSFHVPSANSGLTIGRGYDMGEKEQDEVYRALVDSWVSARDADIISEGASKKGILAKKIVYKNDLLDYKISGESQGRLFELTFVDLRDKIISTYNRAKDVKDPQPIDWANVPDVAMNLLVDLRYRGDAIISNMKVLHPLYSQRRWGELRRYMQDRSNWERVPLERFTKRADYANFLFEDDPIPKKA